MNTPLPPSPGLPSWAYCLMLPVVLLMIVAWRFISADAREARYSRRLRGKPVTYVKSLYAKVKRKR
jgi:hypothetical protein